MIFKRNEGLQKRRFSRVILFWMILTSIVPICVMGYIWTVERISQFNGETERLKKGLYDLNTKLIKDQVDEAVHDIEFSHQVMHEAGMDHWQQTQVKSEDRLKREILFHLSKLRFGREGYVFVNTRDRKALIYDGKLLDQPIDILKSGKPQWIENTKRITDSVSGNEGKYFHYLFKKHFSNAVGSKISYVRYYEPWGWYIGAGVYDDDIVTSINAERAKLINSIRNDFIRLGLIILIIIIILVAINKVLNDSISQNIRAFKKAFSDAANNFTRVNVDVIKHEEFHELGEAANRMISERNHFFEELKQEQILLRSLIDAVPNLIFFKDKESKYLGCNQAFAAYLGMDESELIGRTDIELLGEEAAREYHASDRELLESKKLMVNEELITYPDGSQIRFETIKTIFNDVNGNIQGIIGISHDITARYNMEEELKVAKNQAEQSNQLKTAFLANMSHEIRTPLNAIIGFSNLLVYDDLTAEDKEVYARLITQSGDSLANLVNDIVDMAKIESGQVDVERKPFKVQEIMSDLLVLYREKVNLIESAITVQYQPDPAYPELILNNDAFRMKQIITNLLNNALKFSEKGVISFGYSVKEGFCHFYVSDQGIGMTDESQAVIFEAFRQIDGTYSRQYGGVGLGLSISQKLVRLMGGEIWVQSKTGVGSTFTFKLPLS